MGRTRNQDKKEELKTKIEDMEKSIKEKEGMLKEVVQFQVSKPFHRSQDADAYIEALERQAQIAKERAERARNRKRKR